MGLKFEITDTSFKKLYASSEIAFLITLSIYSFTSLSLEKSRPSLKFLKVSIPNLSKLLTRRYVAIGCPSAMSFILSTSSSPIDLPKREAIILTRHSGSSLLLRGKRNGAIPSSFLEVTRMEPLVRLPPFLLDHLNYHPLEDRL